MWIVILIGSGMTAGGLLLHREVGGEWIPAGVDMTLVRQLHNLMAVPFALTLGLMILTGLLMWGVPKILAQKRVQ